MPWRRCFLKAVVYSAHSNCRALPNPPTLTLAAAGSSSATVVLHSSRHATKAASRRLATLSVSGHWTVKQALIRRATKKSVVVRGQRRFARRHLRGEVVVEGARPEPDDGSDAVDVGVDRGLPRGRNASTEGHIFVALWTVLMMSTLRLFSLLVGVALPRFRRGAPPRNIPPDFVWA